MGGHKEAVARVWDSSEVSQKSAFAYYREGICEAFMELVPDAEEWRRDGFRSRVSYQPLPGGSALNTVRAHSHLVARTKHEIARSPGECYYLNYQTGGECRIEQGGDSVTLLPGDLGIFDSSIPFELEHRSRPMQQVASFLVPKSEFAHLFGGGLCRPRVVGSEPISGPLATEVARCLALNAGTLPAEQNGRLFAMLLELTAMALVGQARPAVTSRAGARRIQISRLIATRSSDPGFSAEQCARLASISPRYLHQLLAGGGESFSSLLRQARLTNAEAALTDPALAHLPISTIALDAGFSDISHFNRAFKERRGCTPGEWRRGPRPKYSL